jgi:hypothetical protein
MLRELVLALEQWGDRLPAWMDCNRQPIGAADRQHAGSIGTAGLCLEPSGHLALMHAQPYGWLPASARSLLSINRQRPAPVAASAAPPGETQARPPQP